MQQKWSQNREKCIESPNVARRWLPRPLYWKGIVDFHEFLMCPRGAQKSCPRNAFSLIVAANAVLDFLVEFESISDENSMKTNEISRLVSYFFQHGNP